MTQYLLSIYQPDHDPVDDVGQVARDVDAVEAAGKAAGAWVFAGGLGSGARVVRKGLVTDGPYVEGKEHVGGFVVIDVGTYDEALDWAKRLSDAATLPVEVRSLDWAR
ncbi:YciI family protein [Tenggerimyces flavus]|uniref:YciI family protein n=1 Tax=Tenggerimyces flavus TaxID=1708749 RepID=A0ABV7Y4N9_9ACTN|nr:YciI family protein [Tenggerimyces flavus]MBM7788385.1 hypothetical protein [Tenggerimyces flavus]